MFLFLNSISTGEIIVILLFILIFFGAESFPGLARNLGRGIRQIRNAGQDIQDEILKSSNEIRREMNANRALEETKEVFEKPLKNLVEDLEDTGKEIEKNIGEEHIPLHSVKNAKKIEQKDKDKETETETELQINTENKKD